MEIKSFPFYRKVTVTPEELEQLVQLDLRWDTKIFSMVKAAIRRACKVKVNK